MDRLSKIFLVALAANCVVLGSSFVVAGTDTGRQPVAQDESVDVQGMSSGTAEDETDLAEEFNPDELQAATSGARGDAMGEPPSESLSLARHFLTDSGAGGNDESGEASSNVNAPEEAGIPGAIVAVIFGIFGLLVIARRSTTR